MYTHTKDINDEVKYYEDTIKRLEKEINIIDSILDKYSSAIIDHYIEKKKTNFLNLIPENNTSMANEFFIKYNMKQEQKNIINTFIFQKFKRRTLIREYGEEIYNRDLLNEQLKDSKNELQKKIKERTKKEKDNIASILMDCPCQYERIKQKNL